MNAPLPGLRDLSPPWLDRLAELWPSRTAVVDPDGGQSYTYPDLQARSLAVAAGLLRRGVGRGDRVAALLNNCVPMLDLFFACGRLGAIFVPLNWRLSGRELADLLPDTEPRLLLLDPDLDQPAGSLPRDTQVARLADHLSPPLAEEPAGGERPETDVRMDDPWLILYTGGTTGVPKGAVLTHGSITWNAINTAVSWGLSEADVGPSFTPMFHTGGWNVFTLPLLLLGGRVILPRRFDPARALAILEREKPTVLFLVPTMFQLLAEQPGFDAADLSCLRWAISGGAPLPAPVYDRWKAKVRVFKQGYGLTEVGPNNFATSDEDAERKRGTVGRLTYFARARIVDDAGADVPDGTAGELLLAGPHMCAGYWRRPEATADAVRGGWFHTGDVAVRDGEGYYYIVDRKKDMIITGGENVYPTEVEWVLYAHPAIREAAIVGLPDPVWGEAVCAVVSLKPGCSATPDELRAYLRDNLAR
ncbi:MAG: long-chain fatty acid--CoA ligase, partial [Chloroflexi bacterium]|nr:long-chain fatty acid--CoA ligase [Chloroflexota bacterium]